MTTIRARGTFFLGGEPLGEGEMCFDITPQVRPYIPPDDRLRGVAATCILIAGTPQDLRDNWERFLQETQREKIRQMASEVAAGPILPIYPCKIFQPKRNDT